MASSPALQNLEREIEKDKRDLEGKKRDLDKKQQELKRKEDELNRLKSDVEVLDKQCKDIEGRLQQHQLEAERIARDLEQTLGKGK